MVLGNAFSTIQSSLSTRRKTELYVNIYIYKIYYYFKIFFNHIIYIILHIVYCVLYIAYCILFTYFVIHLDLHNAATEDYFDHINWALLQHPRISIAYIFLALFSSFCSHVKSKRKHTEAFYAWFVTQWKECWEKHNKVTR